jgi:predicted hydrocarbon binding protein
MARAQTKGTNLIDMVKFLRSKRDEARALLPERLHHYLEQQLNVAAWYPEEDLIALVRALARLLPGSKEDALARIGRLNARMHLQGTYAHLLEGVEPAMLPIRAVALWKTMHDTGEFRLAVEADHAEAGLARFGHPSAEMCTMLGAYLSELFELAGVRDAKVEEVACCRRGSRDCRWRIEWGTAAD